MKTKYIILSSILLLLLNACTEEIDWPLDDTNIKLVVEGEVTTDTTKQLIKLTSTKGYLNNGTPPPVQGAQVILTTDNRIDTLNEEAPGMYYTHSNFYGIPDEVYNISITNTGIVGDNGDDIYIASAVMRNTLHLDSITLSQEDEFEENHFNINGWGQENPEPGDFYFWNYYKNGVLETDTLDEAIFTDDVAVNGNYIPGLTMWWNIKAEPGDTILVESISITKEYYEYIMALMQETSWNSGPFGGPPANPRGNISNGALGFFKASDYSYVETVVK